jgi:hypothetical protein
VEAKIYAAEEALRKANASLASGLGYKLCKCTFPPQIMLWNKERRTNICPACGDYNPPLAPDYRDNYIKVRE